MRRRHSGPGLSGLVAVVLLLFGAAPGALAQGAPGAAPTRPTLASVSPSEVNLASTLTLQINGLDAAGPQAVDPTTFRLRLNGHQFQDLKPERTVPGELAFDLRGLRDDKNGGWLSLVGSPPFSGLKTMKVGATSPVTGDLLTASGTTLSIDLRIFPFVRLAMGVAAAGLIVVAVLLMGRKTDMLRDTAVLPTGLIKPFSLARCQMAWWFVLITCCFIGISLIALDTSHIVTSQSLMLLGISSITALGSAAINIAKSDAPRAIQF